MSEYKLPNVVKISVLTEERQLEVMVEVNHYDE